MNYDIGSVNLNQKHVQKRATLRDFEKVNMKTANTIYYYFNYNKWTPTLHQNLVG